MASVVYFVKDLLFSSKIREVASQVGIDVESVRDPSQLVAAAKGAKLVILDLRQPQSLALLDELKQVETVGFIDHEKLDVIEAAAAKGCKKVLTKGRFSNDLPAMLANLS